MSKPKQIIPEDRIVGKKYTIVHCKGALKSLDKALNGVEARKRDKFRRSVSQQIDKLASGSRMSKENFPPEGNLPKKAGQKDTKKFNALKRIPVRGYCWLSNKYPNTYYISHYIKKDFNDLDARDTEKVGNNWRRIEEDNDEC
jgi:hypothetical protein